MKWIAIHGLRMILPKPTTLLVPLLALFAGTAYASDSIYIARYKGDKACALSYTFDDGLAEHYSLVAPALEKHGFRGTFWIVGSKINGDNTQRRDTTRMTWKQVRELAERGHEVGNHGWAHKSHHRHPLEVIREDIHKNDSAILANVGIMPRTFCYPGNRKTEEGMKLAETGRVGSRTHQRSLGSKWSAAELEKWVAKLIATNDWGVGMTHGITYGYDAFSEPQILWEHLEKVKAQEEQIWVATFCEVLAYTKERDALRLDIEHGKRKIKVKPLLELDRKLFTEKLTLVVEGKAKEGGIRVKQGKKPLPVVRKADKWLVDIDPFGGEVIIE